MPKDDELLRSITTFPKLVKYLRDELQWPIEETSFEDLTFDYEPEELGLDPKTAVKIRSIKQLRPLTAGQPWGVFFVEFERKRLPVVVMRRILSALALKKRASAGRSDQAAWRASDLLFISSFGEEGGRGITFAHFAPDEQGHDLPALKVLGWDGDDTKLHTQAVAESLASTLTWPSNARDINAWRIQWSSAFVLANREVVTTSRELSIQLAKLAVGIRERAKALLASESDRGPLRKLHKAFKEALLHDLTQDGFADMYAQTVAYGLLAARLENPDSPTPLAASALAEMIPPTSPFLKGLLTTFLKVGGHKGYLNFDELGIGDVVDLLRNANLKAVLLDFGDLKPEEDPVLHFYELFLNEYDHVQKMQRGIFYTARPVVHYIVHSVDEILRTEFGLADGLADTTTWGEMAARNHGIMIPDTVAPADPFVQVLDPATGTATFLVEVIDVIYETLTCRWRREGRTKLQIGTLWNEYVPRHLLPRLHGFELLVAPYTIAHIKVGLKLRETGYKFGSTERVRIYLTNSLEDPDRFSDKLGFAIPALANEALAVNVVKRRLKPTVILGNPPYAGTSSNPSVDKEGELTLAGRLIQTYKTCDGHPLGEQNPKYLQDDYVKFMRFAQWKIDQGGAGILGFITNHGYLDNPTFRGMRQSLMASFPRLHVLDLHGSSKRKEKCPDGQKDENVFDIMPGVAIILGVERPALERGVWKADLWGLRDVKYRVLGSNSIGSTQWEGVKPRSPLYLFVRQDAEVFGEYEPWLRVSDIFPVHVSGFKTHRDNFAVSFTRQEMEHRLGDMADAGVLDSELRLRYDIPETRDWNVKEARLRLREIGSDWRSLIHPCTYRPFDNRWCCLDEVAMDWPRLDTTSHMLQPNMALIIGRAGQVTADSSTWNLAFCSSTVTDTNLFYRGGPAVMPLYLYEHSKNKALFRSPKAAEQTVNLPASVLDTLRRSHLTLRSPDDVTTYIYAILYSQSYRQRYGEFLDNDFPHIPFPSSNTLFLKLVGLGKRMVDLHLVQSSELESPSCHYSGDGDNGVTKLSYNVERGRVYINSNQYFDGISPVLWSYEIGGYPVLMKWLKDRGPKGGGPGRVLSPDDILHYRKMVTAISKTIELQAEIDRVIATAGGFPAAFMTGEP